MRIAILALDELFDTGLTVMLDAFTLANKFSALQMGGRPRFDLSIVGVRRRVRSGQGLPIPLQAITPALKPDWAVVPALNTGRPEQLIPALERRDVIQAGAQVRTWHAEGAQIAASCVGTFLVAQAGMSPRATYSTFNMGAGFAVYCAPGDGAAVVGLAAELGLPASVAGSAEAGPRRVILEPVGVLFEGDDLDLAPRRS